MEVRVKLPKSTEIFVVWPHLIVEAHYGAANVWRVSKYDNANDPGTPPTTENHIYFRGPSGEEVTASPVSAQMDVAAKGICAGNPVWALTLADITAYTDVLRRAVVEKLHARITLINKQEFVIGDTQRSDGSWIVKPEGFHKIYQSPEVDYGTKED
jgi:hypothetical protein